MSLFKKLYITTKREVRYRGTEIGRRRFIFKYDDSGSAGCTNCRYYDLCSEVYIPGDGSSLLHICAVDLKGNYYVPS